MRFKGKLNHFLYRLEKKILPPLMKSWYGYEVNPEDEDNIELATEYLKEGPLIAYFNHTFLADAALVVTYLLDNFGENLDIMGGPVSLKHYDLSRRLPLSKGTLYALVLRSTPLLGIDLFPVPQHYDRRHYEWGDIKRTLERGVEISEEILVPHGIFFIAPEETRSEDKSLQRAKRGLGDLLRNYKDRSISLLPIAIIPKSPSDQIDKELNLGVNFDIRAGKPFHAEEVLKSKASSFEGLNTTDLAMLRLAILLPDEMRGVYAPQSSLSELVENV